MSSQQVNPESHNTAAETQAFPAPPPQSGAAQNHETSLSGMSIQQNPIPTQQNFQDNVQSDQSHVSSLQHDHEQQQPPPLPQRHSQNESGNIPQYNPASYADQPAQTEFLPPPQRLKVDYGSDDPSNPEHYMRNPHKLTAYLVPFPAPQIKGTDPGTVPTRFLIWTPPPPPLIKPKEGEKEEKLHKVQRKWQEEIREAKTSNAKIASWKGAKSRALKGIDWAMGKTTTSSLDFLGRVSDGNASDSDHEGDTAKKTVGIDEMILVFPSTVHLTEEQMREEFVNNMLRTKTKAQRDTIIATGLMPVAFGIDILLTLVWPFGGLGEIDTVWAYSSFRGAKTSRSVTKRLASSSESGNTEEDKLRLKFTPSQRTELFKQYLSAECHKIDSKLFPEFRTAPTESQIVEAIGWSPSHTGGEQKNWEDEQWQLTEVKDDIKSTMNKAAKEWVKWCKVYAANPEKAMKK